jgi:tetratricopeptide (TPR) repeat protein
MTVSGLRIFMSFVLLLGIYRLEAQDRFSDWYEGFLGDESRNTIEESLNIVKLRLENARLQNDKVAEVNALNELGLIKIRLYQYDSATDLFIEALVIEDSLALKDAKILTHLGFARVYEDVGEYDLGADFLESALSLSSASDDKGFRSLILNRIGKINVAKGDEEEAHRRFQEAISYAQEVEDLRAESLALSNIGNLLAAQGNYTEALDTHKKSLAIRRRTGDRNMEATSLREIGELFRMMKNRDRALANHGVALNIRRALKDKSHESQSYNDIGVLYFEQGSIERASTNFQLARQAAQESGNQRELQRSYEFLSACYAAAGDYKEALENKNHAVGVQDMIQGDLNDRRPLKSFSVYDSGKKEKLIKTLEDDQLQREHELEMQKRLRNF